MILPDFMNIFNRKIRTDIRLRNHNYLQPDWLLIYLTEDDILILTLIDVSTHADLFDE